MNEADLAPLYDELSRRASELLRMQERLEQDIVNVLAGLSIKPKKKLADNLTSLKKARDEARNSVPALLARIRAFRAGAGEAREDLTEQLDGLKAADLGKLFTGLGEKKGKSKQESITRLLDGPPPDPLSEEVAKAQAVYDGLKASLSGITVGELRSQFGATLGKAPKPVVAGILSQLGYSSDGGVKALRDKLLDNLTSLKVSIDQKSEIRSL